MRRSILVGVALLATTGCVTESVYVGSDKPVVENRIDNDEAARTRISLALKYLASGDSTQAKYNLERAAKFAPKLPEVHYTTAYYYQQVGENELAKESYLRAIDIAPDDPNTLNNYGVFLCGLGEYDEASEYILRAIEIPSYLRVSQSYENLALCAIENNEFDEAEEYLEASVKHSPSRGSSLVNLSAIYYAKSDLHRAQTFMNRYEKSGRISSRSLMLSYLIENRMGHIEKANTLALTLQQTYSNSIEAQQIKLKKTSDSEFERLREKYRKNELSKLKKELNPDGKSVVAKPQVKVVKRKAQPEQAEVTPSKAEIEPQVKVEVAKPTTQVAKNEVVVAQTKAQQQSPDPQRLPLKLVETPYHVMKGGENLFSVSVKYNVKLAKLLEWNGLTENDPVFAGTKIYLNNPNIYHLVKDGDTLFSISVKYNLRMKSLAEWNEIQESATLSPGKKILLVNPKTYAL
ncbi:MAG: type IV pilus biogenesis/stability protein PilW [Pseudomonadota bacterium]|uniref:type IV pilus biogenesis/stability protein PilW n=1 Tax=Pseudoalteromonas TaxID=53246 RepID=UPI00110C1E38|nr:type IV pilus biogenesis/stability protein PilW [Pseudoalteromonas spongiae]MEC8325775.1 type IV pilus biogenesis/stability protein PilW [Pseudomonadota bacterium]TMO85624.1 type IV pilus biogenesis/stability protein PilW [Pseudoalteromonas spongiae]